MMDVINEEEISLEDGILHHQENVDLLPANIELSHDSFFHNFNSASISRFIIAGV